MNSKKCEVTQMGYSPWNGIDTKHSVASKPLGCMETLGNQRCKAEVECEGGASAQQLITFRFGQKVSGRSGIAPARRGMSRTSFFQTVGSALRRSEEHTSELQSQSNLVCRLLLEKKKKTTQTL